MGQVQEKTVAEVLEAAASLIEPEGAWTQGWFARDYRGTEVEESDDDATCWCVRGAFHRVANGDYAFGEQEAFATLRPLVGIGFGGRFGSIEQWNDDPERTQSEVVARLREAAAVARERGL